MKVTVVALTLILSLTLPHVALADSDKEYLPIVKVQPVYPRRALMRGVTGWVVLEFTVNEMGAVENPVVVENCGWTQKGTCENSPNDVFDSSAKKAALKFKYIPKVVDGQAVSTPGVRNTLTFELVSE